MRRFFRVFAVLFGFLMFASCDSFFIGKQGCYDGCQSEYDACKADAKDTASKQKCSANRTACTKGCDNAGDIGFSCSQKKR
jgi:hypothetical protein